MQIAVTDVLISDWFIQWMYLAEEKRPRSKRGNSPPPSVAGIYASQCFPPMCILKHCSILVKRFILESNGPRFESWLAAMDCVASVKSHWCQWPLWEREGNSSQVDTVNVPHPSPLDLLLQTPTLAAEALWDALHLPLACLRIWGGLVKKWCTGPHSTVSHSSGLRGNLKISPSSKFPGKLICCSGTTLWESLSAPSPELPDRLSSFHK